MRSEAATVEAYIAGLPEERRAFLAKLRAHVNEHLPTGYEEGMQYGMIGWYVPLEVLPDTYNGQPLSIVALANQKQKVSLYLMGVYADPPAAERLQQGFADSGKKLDMGKSCVRFRREDDVPWDVIAEALKRPTVEEFVAQYRASRRGGGQ
jgi:uncharacterized protein YdhG (YjbR/CyaY superfamily)